MRYSSVTEFKTLMQLAHDKMCINSTMKVKDCISQDIGYPGHAAGTNRSLCGTAMEPHPPFPTSRQSGTMVSSETVILFDECKSVLQENLYDASPSSILLKVPRRFRVSYVRIHQRCCDDGFILTDWC
jgi:hypothetical protein